MGYLIRVEGEALSRYLPTVQLTIVARKPKGCADPDSCRKAPARGTQADIHASPVASLTPWVHPHLDNGLGLNIPNSPFISQ